MNYLEERKQIEMAKLTKRKALAELDKEEEKNNG
jgi:hypothetical protein